MVAPSCRVYVTASVCLSRRSTAAATCGRFAAELGLVHGRLLRAPKLQMRVTSCCEPRCEARHRLVVSVPNNSIYPSTPVEVSSDGSAAQRLRLVTQRPSDPGIQRPGGQVDPVTVFYNELQMSTYVRRRVFTGQRIFNNHR